MEIEVENVLYRERLKGFVANVVETKRIPDQLRRKKSLRETGRGY
jgi:hypothetical protein